MIKTAAISLIILFLTVPFTYSQDQLDSLELIQTAVHLNLLSSKFDKQLNTFNLRSILDYNQKIDNLYFNLNENYNSTYIRSFDASTRNEHLLNASGSYSFNSFYNVGLLVDNNIYSDSRQIEINQASLSSLTLFSQFNPFDKLSIAPYIGYENNQQVGESDNGLVYGGEGFLNNYNISDFNLLSEFKFKNEGISPRKNSLSYLNLNLTNNIEKDFSNIINFQYFQNRKDFYFQADSVTAKQFNIINNIQSRIETNNVLQDNLIYGKFLNIFALNLTGRVSWRTVDRDTRYRTLALASPSIFDTKINEMRIELESITDYHSENFEGSFRLNYSERDEKHLTKPFPGVSQNFFDERSDQESMKNNISKRITASLIGSWHLSSSDELNFSFYQNKLRYDTPSLDNYDDRDELLSIVRLKYVKHLNSFFDVFANVEGTFNHIVYIFAEESSNNNVNRILKLTSGGYYFGKNISSMNSFDVSANYTVYDFEDLTPNYRSFSFRQFTATDSSRIKFDSRLYFVHYGYIKLSEQGDLKWASFSTHPTRFLQEIYSEPKFVLNYGVSYLSLGMRIYSLKTYNYQGIIKIIDSKYVSLAPLTEVSFFMNNSLRINILGWYEFINISDQTYKQQANLSMMVNWNF
ncbi:MAG: hypothetical protein M1480_04265 [Bacteroidetes bacterium]|nr:hypothetical protein [Bacteroidota bacterium]